MKKNLFSGLLLSALVATITVCTNNVMLGASEQLNIELEEAVVSENDVPALGFSQSAIELSHRNHAAGSTTYSTIDVGTWRFNQSFARGELFSALDAARSNPANWWLCTNFKGQPITTKSVSLSNPHFVYDYDLEKMAMQRCVEVMMQYSHMRPCLCSYSDVMYTVPVEASYYIHSLYEMNSAFGRNAQDIVDAYMEDTKAPAALKRDDIEAFGFSMREYMDDNYFMHNAGQGHRQIILADKNYRVGIGCIVRSDGKIFTEILTSDNGELHDDSFHYNTTPTPCIDTYKEMQIDIAPTYPMCSVNTTSKMEDIPSTFRDEPTLVRVLRMKKGESINISQIYMGEGRVAVTTADKLSNNWIPDDSSIATYDASTGTINLIGKGVVFLFSSDNLHKISIDVASDEPEQPAVTPTPTPPTNPVAPSNPTVTGGETTIKESPVTLTRKSVSVKYKSVKKKNMQYDIKATSPSGTCTYKVVSAPKGCKKYIKISSKGKLTVKKGAKKGTYKIQVSSPRTATYFPTCKTVTVKVK